VIDALRQDLRYAWRTILRSPVFAFSALAALGLGIGATSAVWSVFHGVLLRPLPYRDPDSLVLVWNRYPKMGLSRASISGPDFVERRDLNRVFESAAAFTGAGLNLTGRGEPEQIRAQRVSASLLSVLGVAPARGRDFLPAEDAPGRNGVVLVSDGAWKRRFGSDPGMVGRALSLDGVPHTVVGVLPAGFYFPDPEVEMWVPIALSAEDTDVSRRGNEYLSMIARLKPGVTPEAVQADLDHVSALALERTAPAPREFFLTNGWGAWFQPLREHVVARVRPALLVLLGAVVCVLLIACANVSNLLLARAAARQREIAVRAALGAGRGRLARQLLTESALLALLGGAVGLLVAAWSVDVLVAARPSTLPRLHEIRLDLQVVLFTALVSAAAGVLCGLLPALQAGRPDLAELLREAGPGASPGRGRARLRAALVVSQVALALVLLAGAGLLMRTALGLERSDPGFRTPNLLTMVLSLPEGKYPRPADRIGVIRRLLDAVQSLPGVTSASAGSHLPFAPGGTTFSFVVEGRLAGPGEPHPLANVRAVTPGHLRTLGIPLLRGRDFTDGDGEESPAVIVDARLARRFWADGEPLGRRISFDEEDHEWLRVVGVAGNVNDDTTDSDPRPTIYLPYSQGEPGWAPGRMFVVLRAAADPRALIPSARRAVASVDPEQPVSALRTMEEYVDDALAQPRFRAALVGVFALVALALAAVGLYGVIAYSVAQRRQEIGVRLALGARPIDVVRLVVGQGVRMALAGVGLGVAGALALTRLLSGLLFAVTPSDPLSFSAACAVLLCVALAAAYLPARRAAQVDPAIVLREA
jgi:putative ABC transport system permease protein